MKKLQFVEAFAAYGAQLANVNWAVSSIADDGSLVVSCWNHFFKKMPPHGLVYRDNLRRWGGSKSPGKNLLQEHLTRGLAEGLAVRIVVATANEPAELERVSDASTIKKSFHIRPDWVGRVTSFDGDNFDIEISAKI